MNLLQTLATSNSRIPKNYREEKTLEEIKKDLLELDFEQVTNEHLLNLQSLLFPKKKTVTSTSFVGEKNTLDLEVIEPTHSYWANGTPVHNTINLPSHYPYEDFKSLYMKMYDSQVIKGGTTYRAGTMTEVLGSGTSSKTSVEKIVRTTAPKRPKELDCDIHQLIADGEKWLVIVGLLENEPYEVFAFKTKTINLSNKLKQGKLVKEKKGKYNLDIDGFIIENLSENFESAEEEALTRMISTSLRHGADIEFIVDQLAKSHGIITSFTKAIGRILKKYIKETKLVKTCDNCGSTNVSLQEGCFICLDCSSSKCS